LYLLKLVNKSNKKALETQISELNTEERLLKKANITIREKQNLRTSLTQDVEDNEAALVEVENDAAEVSKLLKELEEEIEAQKSEVGEKKEELAELEESGEDYEGAQDLVKEVKDKEGELLKVDADIGLATTKRNQLDNASESVETEINTVTRKVNAYDEQSSTPTLSTSIARVYSHYGYVTVQGGDSAGIIKGSTLDVVRGGVTVGKLLVTTVEPNLAAADIIPESLIDGTHFHSGDKVVSGTPFIAKN